MCSSDLWGCECYAFYLVSAAVVPFGIDLLFATYTFAFSAILGAVAIVFPGRAWRESDNNGSAADGEFGLPDADGTIRTVMEDMVGVCRNGKVLFVSAGPDGLIGSRYCAGGERKEASLDNVYSYEPENP